MEDHFRAFSFVDRITAHEPGVRIRGQFEIPRTVDKFAMSLVSEAVGQLAAWASMAVVGFSHRPVAGIAGRIELISEVRPGDRLELSTELQSVDVDSVGYSGEAKVGGREVVRLQNCVGPMVPVEDFDDPQALRDRFNLICQAGAVPGGFAGIPALALERINGEAGKDAVSMLRVPAAAAFFADHFPRRPVFPGTLLMHANLKTASQLVGDLETGSGSTWVPRVVTDVKLRTFIPPGESLQIHARLVSSSDTSLTTIVESRIRQKLVGSAKIEFLKEVCS